MTGIGWREASSTQHIKGGNEVTAPTPCLLVLQPWWLQRGNRPVVTLHSGRVADFNGVNVSTVSSTVLRVNPDIVEARALAAW